MTGPFIDMQARVGVTVHAGGLPATRKLHDLCHVAEAREILEVGCGIGVGPVHAATTHGCRVVGIDLDERMVEWSRRRAREAHVDDRVDLRVADVLALPFEDGRFDATICESVLAFVADKEQAIRELVRVTRPGGHVGLNEMFLLSEAPSPGAVALARLMATEIVSLEAMCALWDGSGLRDRSVRTYRIDIAREIRGRLRWIGPRWFLRGCARLARLYLTEPPLRPVLRLMVGGFPAATDDALRAPGAPAAPAARASFGYGLFVGRR